MRRKELTKTSKLLIYLAALEDVITPMANIYEFRNRVLFSTKGSFNSTLYKFQKRGWIKLVDKNAERFIKLTAKGELEALVAKAKLPFNGKWDGKWRLIIFDIPADYNKHRDLLRRLLKKNNPYPLNREAVKYLQEAKLTPYIRIIKVEEMDNDRELRKLFNLK
jgi:DNA-binding transcriptional regulator PaaX